MTADKTKYQEWGQVCGHLQIDHVDPVRRLQQQTIGCILKGRRSLVAHRYLMSCRRGDYRVSVSRRG
jgi:hypothetical protein